MNIPAELQSLPCLTQGEGILWTGGLIVERNAWGAKDPRTGETIPHELAVYLSLADSDRPRSGWVWSVPQPHGGVVLFPEIIWGKKPWAQVSSSFLPTYLSKMYGLEVEYETRTAGTGEFNSTFECWMCSPPTVATEWEGLYASDKNITHEVMFWVGNQGSKHPAGSCIERGVAPVYGTGETCDLWLDHPTADRAWSIISLVFHEPRPAGVIEIGTALLWLVKLGYVPENSVMASCEYGNEVWSGSGHTIVDRFAVGT